MIFDIDGSRVRFLYQSRSHPDMALVQDQDTGARFLCEWDRLLAVATTE